MNDTNIILQNCMEICFDSHGFNASFEELSSSNAECSKGIIIDASQISSANNSYFMYLLENIKDHIYGVRLSQIKENNSLNKLIKKILVINRFNSMIDINISYLSPFSQSSLDTLCHYVDPITNRDCPLRNLSVIRCGLESKGTIALLTSLSQNIVLERLILSGNAMNDSSIPALIRFLSSERNQISVLGLADNNLTVVGMSSFRSAKVCFLFKNLRSLLLNDNPIGDKGADAIFESILDSREFETLNLSNCNVINCSWARNLNSLLCLSTLHLSHNLMDDSGLQLLAEGLADNACLRYLDLSYNKFGGTAGNTSLLKG